MGMNGIMIRVFLGPFLFNIVVVLIYFICIGIRKLWEYRLVHVRNFASRLEMTLFPLVLMKAGPFTAAVGPEKKMDFGPPPCQRVLPPPLDNSL